MYKFKFSNNKGTSSSTVPQYSNDLCVYCFDAIVNKLSNVALPPLPSNYNPDFDTGGIFVTWDTIGYSLSFFC